jgi:hypothetical protein
MDKKEQIDNQNKYIDSKYDRFPATFPAGKKDMYQGNDPKNIESLNASINRLIEEDIFTVFRIFWNINSYHIESFSLSKARVYYGR